MVYSRVQCGCVKGTPNINMIIKDNEVQSTECLWGAWKTASYIMPTVTKTFEEFAKQLALMSEPDMGS